MLTVRYVLRIRTSVLGDGGAVVVVESMLELVVVVTDVVVAGHEYSGHGHPSGQPSWHGHCIISSL